MTRTVTLFTALAAGLGPPAAAGGEVGPYARQVAEQGARLRSASARDRAGAAEALGFLRARAAEGGLVVALRDPQAPVRREAALALAWCGGREALEPLAAALDDGDWSVAQAARVTLENLTGMDSPFDALAAPRVRADQAAAWRERLASLRGGLSPREALELASAGPGEPLDEEAPGRLATALRALGALGGEGAREAALACLRRLRALPPARARSAEPALREAIRALGRLRGGGAAPESLESLEP
ncbi:MAG: HEAT repeat domain-containing protein, partial [Planctomycetes bacterium]|nr:HEAT repeat domain-containing protein [Planctomycetota bacterium]